MLRISGRKFVEFSIEMDMSLDALDAITDAFHDFNVNIITGLMFAEPSKGKRVIELFADCTEATLPLEDFVKNLKAIKEVFNVKFKESPYGGLALCQLHYPSKVAGENAIIFKHSCIESWFKRLWRVYGTGAASILYDSGVEVGRNSTKTFMEKTGLEGEELLRFIVAFLQSLGWGVFRIAELDMEYLRATVDIDDLFECVILRDVAPGPTSNFVRGYVVGVAQEVWGEKDVVGEEAKCIAKGDPYCRIKIKVKE
jgi:predicted hydrocarbon binding protein